MWRELSRFEEEQGRGRWDAVGAFGVVAEGFWSRLGSEPSETGGWATRRKKNHRRFYSSVTISMVQHLPLKRGAAQELRSSTCDYSSQVLLNCVVDAISSFPPLVCEFECFYNCCRQATTGGMAVRQVGVPMQAGKPCPNLLALSAAHSYWILGHILCLSRLLSTPTLNLSL